MEGKLFKNMKPEDRALLDKFIADNKKDGKSDQEIIKDATRKASLLMFLIFFMLIVMVVAIVILTTDADSSHMWDDLKKMLSTVYPKFKENTEVPTRGNFTGEL